MGRRLSLLRFGGGGARLGCVRVFCCGRLIAPQWARAVNEMFRKMPPIAGITRQELPIGTNP